MFSEKNVFIAFEIMEKRLQRLLIIGPKFVFSVLAWLPKWPKNRNPEPTKSPLMQDWLFRLGLVIVSLQCSYNAIQAKSLDKISFKPSWWLFLTYVDPRCWPRWDQRKWVHGFFRTEGVLLSIFCSKWNCEFHYFLSKNFNMFSTGFLKSYGIVLM